LTYAGNHGLEILHPDGSRFVHPMPKEYEDKVGDLLKVLQEQVIIKLHNIINNIRIKLQTDLLVFIF